MANKVTYGFDMVHYALYKEGAAGEIGQWETPKRIVNGMGFSPTAQGGSSSVYGDNKPAFTVTQDNGVQGDLEMLIFPDEFLIDVLGWEHDENGVLIEKAGVAQKPFALMFEVSGDESPIRVVYYYCIGAKPNTAYITSKESVQVEGKTMAITATPLDFGGFSTASVSIVQSKSKTVFDSWFTKIYEPKLVEEA